MLSSKLLCYTTIFNILIYPFRASQIMLSPMVFEYCHKVSQNYTIFDVFDFFNKLISCEWKCLHYWLLYTFLVNLYWIIDKKILLPLKGFRSLSCVMLFRFLADVLTWLYKLQDKINLKSIRNLKRGKRFCVFYM